MPDQNWITAARELLADLVHPEQYGHAVPKEARHRARDLLELEKAPAEAPQRMALWGLPAFGEPMEDGVLVGILPLRDGACEAIVKLPGEIKGATWRQARKWASEKGGHLPSLHAAMAIHLCAPSLFPLWWHWLSNTCEPDSDGRSGRHLALIYLFREAIWSDIRKTDRRDAVAVRHILVRGNRFMERRFCDGANGIGKEGGAA